MGIGTKEGEWKGEREGEERVKERMEGGTKGEWRKQVGTRNEGKQRTDMEIQ